MGVTDDAVLEAMSIRERNELLDEIAREQIEYERDVESERRNRWK